MADTTTKILTFRGLDGFAGFLHGKQYTVEVTKEDDGSGDVLVSLPHVPPIAARSIQRAAMGGMVE